MELYRTLSMETVRRRPIYWYRTLSEPWEAIVQADGAGARRVASTRASGEAAEEDAARARSLRAQRGAVERRTRETGTPDRSPRQAVSPAGTRVGANSAWIQFG